MPLFADGRIPVTVVADPAALDAALAARPGAAVLGPAPVGRPAGAVAVAGFAKDGPHPAACACCAGRSPLASALDQLFLDRVRGRTGWFDRVVALLPDEAGREALARALREDAVVASRYRAG